MEEQIRLAVFDWLKQKSHVNGGVFSRKDLEYGFQYKRKTINLVGALGIWKPKDFETPISITTTTKGTYDDGVRTDGILRYCSGDTG
jgi:hypothetical protein